MEFLCVTFVDRASFSKYDDIDLSTAGAKTTFFALIPLLALPRSSVYDSFASSIKLLLAFIEKLLLLSFSLLLDSDDVSVIGEAPRFTVSAPENASTNQLQ